MGVVLFKVLVIKIKPLKHKTNGLGPLIPFGGPMVHAVCKRPTRVGAISLAIVSVLLSACAFQRAQTAAEAKTAMINMTKEQVLSCMGVPSASMTEGNTEVWTYESGNGRTDITSMANATTFGQDQTVGTVTRIGPTSYWNANTAGMSNTNLFGFSTTRHRSCTINVVMSAGHVSRVDYSGPTGGLLTPGEQCAYAVQNCAR